MPLTLKSGPNIILKFTSANMSQTRKLCQALLLPLVIISVIAISNLYIDWLWFAQFNLHNALLRRWLFQFIFFLISLIVCYVAIIWQKQWLINDKDNFNTRQTRRNPYGLSILATIVTLILNLTYLINISWKSTFFDKKTTWKFTICNSD